MKNYYVAVVLTFLLSFQRSRSTHNLTRSSSRNEKSEEVKICITAECIETASMLNKYMRRDVDPCKNFYKYACGSFSITSKNIHYSQLRHAYELDKRILYYLNSDHDHNIQAFGKIQRIFRLCMDKDAIEEFGVSVIELQVSNVGLPTAPPFHQMTTKANNFDRKLAKIHRDAVIPFLFSVEVSNDNKDYAKNVFIIETDNFTITELDDAVMFKEYYKEYMMGVINHLYKLEDMEISRKFLDPVSRRIDEVLQFFFSIHKAITEFRKSVRICESIKIKNLQKKTDKILRNSNVNFNWMKYLSTLFQNTLHNVENYFHFEEPAIVCSMKYIEDILKIISGIDEEVLEASLWWVTVSDVANIADRKLRKLLNKFFHDTGVLYERQDHCLDFVKEQFSHALTHLLLKEVDSERDIAEIVEIAENVRKSFEETFKNAQWLDESTREEAIRKLNKIEIVISHENWIENLVEIENKYADVKLKSSWYMTRRTEKVRSINNQLHLLFTKNQLNEKRFLLDPLNLNAMYYPFYNTVFIPFKYLGLPFIHHGLHYMDYGALAFTIGHEFMHAFTREGEFIDSSGDLKNWWNKNTLQELKKRTECFVRSYREFIFKGKVMQNDGYLTLDENIADNVGMKLAFDAYDLYAAKYGPEEKLTGFENLLNSEQLLTLAMAIRFCWIPPDNYTDEPMQNQDDVHSPPPLRVNGIFMNSDRIAKIWKCPKRSPMNPSKKCYIW